MKNNGKKIQKEFRWKGYDSSLTHWINKKDTVIKNEVFSTITYSRYQMQVVFSTKFGFTKWFFRIFGNHIIT